MENKQEEEEEKDEMTRTRNKRIGGRRWMGMI
jgi:hypothetical protein